MVKALEITVCRGCAWKEKKIRRAVETLRERHPDRITLRKRDCLDACKRDPVVAVGKKLLAPAKPKAIRKAVEKRLD